MSQKNEELYLNIEKLPDYFQRMVELVHIKTDAAAEIILPTLLSVMSLSCQDSFDIEPINGRKYPLSLYHVVLARSGCRKSTVYKLLTKAISEFEQQLEQDFYIEKDNYERSLVLWNIKFSALNKCYQKALNQGIKVNEALLNLEECLVQKPVAPIKKRLVINDSTSEGLAQELGDGYRVLSLMSDEAGELFESSLLRKTPLLNSLWCAEGKSVSRASRDNYVIKDCRFSLLLMVQPALFDSFMGKKGKKAKSSGFLARSLLVDLDQIQQLCEIKNVSHSTELSLADLSATLINHLQKGIKRRENDEERHCITLAHDAQGAWNGYYQAVKKMMEPGGELHAYDDYASRFMEHASRIAGVMQMFMTPDSTVVTLETLESAVYITQWHLNHFIKKIDNFKEVSDAEKLLLWLEEHLVSNKSYDFRRNDIIKNGPYSLRRSDRLRPALEKLQQEAKVQLFEKNGINYVKFTGARMTPEELAERLNIPLSSRGVFILNNSPR
ncbi:TPA: DUF3987 domain-containing protein [Proteus mirabilis]|nr:DUF3987 domain-containing protein [Proteus mirabilis]